MLPCCVGSVRTLQLRTRLPCLCGGDEVIHDRIAFAGQNFKPLMTLRDAWAAEASSWLSQYGQLKRGYDREVEATKAAEARMNGRGSGDEPAAKRMRVRSGQVAKEKYQGSLTVSPGDTCIFVETCTNPLWSRVKMDDDGRLGIVSASKLEVVVEETIPDPSDDDADLPDPSDDEGARAEAELRAEMQPPSDDEDAAANAYVARMAVDDEAAREVDDAAFVERAQAEEAAARTEASAAQAAAAAECGYDAD